MLLPDHKSEMVIKCGSASINPQEFIPFCLLNSIIIIIFSTSLKLILANPPDFHWRVPNFSYPPENHPGPSYSQIFSIWRHCTSFFFFFYAISKSIILIHLILSCSTVTPLKQRACKVSVAV